jgi:glycosyltransferase involved in cell wall biosynthesis
MRPPVTYVVSHASRGGQEAYLATLLGELAPGEIAGVVALADGPGLARLAATGTPLWVLPTPHRAGLPLSIVRLRRLLRARGARLVHADGLKAALCAVIATGGTAVPVVWMRHDGAFDGFMARAVARRCAAVVGVSAAVLGTFADLPGTPIHLVPNGIPDYDVDRADAALRLRAALGAPAHAPVVAHVGRVVPNKGQCETIEAAPAVLRAHPDARFAFVGEADPATPDHIEELQARGRALGIAPALGFLGYREDAVPLIAGADVLVAPSLQQPGFYGWREGFGLAVAEAMAVGTPVVAYDDQALVETLRGAGTVVPSGDRAQLARAVSELLADPGLRRERAEAGRRRAQDLRLDRAVEQLRGVYGSLSRARTGAGSART